MAPHYLQDLKMSPGLRLSALVCLMVFGSSVAIAASDFDKGLESYADGMYAEAAQHWQNAADDEDVRATFNLAILYEHGNGVAQDIARAVALYRRAAKQNFPDAQFSLANILMQGAGTIPRRVDEALMWYLQAADGGHVQSQFLVGSMLYKGEVVPQDKASATSWLELASHNGHFEAQSLLHVIESEADAGIYDVNWVLEREPGEYTVELFQSPDLARAKKFIRIVGLQTAAIYESADDIHHVVSGVFDSLDAAKAALSQLPEPLRIRLPKIRQFGQIIASLQSDAGNLSAANGAGQ